MTTARLIGDVADNRKERFNFVSGKQSQEPRETERPQRDGPLDEVHKQERTKCLIAELG